jgi:hypothetical protein
MNTDKKKETPNRRTMNQDYNIRILKPDKTPTEQKIRLTVDGSDVSLNFRSAESGEWVGIDVLKKMILSGFTRS